MAAILNQGQFGTCVAHAFAKAFTDGVLGKYRVQLKILEICALAKSKVDMWEGSRLVDMCDAWNDNFVDTWLQVTDNTCCRIKVEFQKLDTIGEAYAYMQKVEGALLIMVSTGGHALAVNKPYKKVNEMRGVNSWGAEDVVIEVTAENFSYAVTVDPVILEVKDGNGNVCDIPDLSRLYNEMEEVQKPEQDDSEEDREDEEEDEEEEDEEEEDEEEEDGGDEEWNEYSDWSYTELQEVAKKGQLDEYCVNGNSSGDQIVTALRERDADDDYTYEHWTRSQFQTAASRGKLEEYQVNGISKSEDIIAALKEKNINTQ